MLKCLQHSETILIKIPLGVIQCILIDNSNSGSGDNIGGESNSCHSNGNTDDKFSCITQ